MYMGKTIRKDREDKKYLEGNPKKEDLHTYKCKCEYCTNVRKKKLKEKALKIAMATTIQEFKELGAKFFHPK